MKKLLTILVLIMLIISFFQITSMYALYKEQIQGKYSTLLGAWEIRVNASKVASKTGQQATFTIANNQLGYVESEYIQAGKIAPNGQAYFDIVIDPSNIYTDTDGNESTAYTDVSIIYTIEIDKDATSSTNVDLEFLDVLELVNGENHFEKVGEDDEIVQATNDVSYKEGNTYTSVIPVSKITEGYKNYVRLYFKWKNVEDNNVQDTALGTTEGAKLTIPLKINLKQYTGEEIGDGSNGSGEASQSSDSGDSGESGDGEENI